MGIIQRFFNIMRSNVNDLLEKAEDPAKMIEQTLLDLRHDLAEVKEETAGVMADERAAKRKVDECAAKIKDYERAAQNALKSGNEADARKLIEKMQRFENNLVSLQENYEIAKSNSEKMQQMYDKLSADVEDLEARKDAIKGKVAAAKAQKRVNEVTSGGIKSGANIAAFERMEEKADKMLDSALAAADLDAGADSTEDLVEKYSRDNASAAVEDKLAAMKKDLGL